MCGCAAASLFIQNYGNRIHSQIDFQCSHVRAEQSRARRASLAASRGARRGRAERRCMPTRPQFFTNNQPKRNALGLLLRKNLDDSRRRATRSVSDDEITIRSLRCGPSSIEVWEFGMHKLNLTSLFFVDVPEPTAGASVSALPHRRREGGNEKWIVLYIIFLETAEKKWVPLSPLHSLSLSPCARDERHRGTYLYYYVLQMCARFRAERELAVDVPHTRWLIYTPAVAQHTKHGRRIRIENRERNTTGERRRQ